MSFGRNLQNEVSQEQPKKSVFPSPSKQEQKENVANMIGLMGSMAVEAIISDIEQMIDKKMNLQLHGYVFALSRIMRHDVAWQCIVHAFGNKNTPIPRPYFTHFGQTPNNVNKQRVTAT